MIPMPQIDAIGLPYHGPVRGLQVTLPNTDTKPISARSHGGVWVMRHPSAPGANRSEDQQQLDADNGLEWHDYLIVTSSEKYVGNTPLGANNWLYVDSAGHVWNLSCLIDNIDDYHFTFTVTLKKLFGYFTYDDRYTNVNRVLISKEFNLIEWNINGTNFFTEINGGATNAYGLDFDETGANAVFNIYFTDGVGISKQWNFDYSTGKIGLLGYIDISISGNGSMDPDTLGDGITADVVVGDTYHNFNDSNASTTPPPPDDGSPTSDWGSWSACQVAFSGTTFGTDVGSNGNGCPQFRDVTGITDWTFGGTSYQNGGSATDQQLRRVFNGNVPGFITYKRESYQRWAFKLQQWGSNTSIERFTYGDSGFPYCGIQGFVGEIFNDNGSPTGDRWRERWIGVDHRILTPGGGDINFAEDDQHWKDNIYTLEERFSSACPDLVYTWEGHPQENYTTNPENVDVFLINGGKVGLLTKSSFMTKVAAVEGGIYENASDVNVSYHPERDEWLVDATQQVSWV